MTALEKELELLKDVLKNDDGLTPEDRKDLESEIAELEKEVAAMKAGRESSKIDQEKAKKAAAEVTRKKDQAATDELGIELPKEPTPPSKKEKIVGTRKASQSKPKKKSYCLEKAKKVREQKNKAQKEKLLSIAAQIPNTKKEELKEMSNTALKKLIQKEGNKTLQAEAGIKTLKEKVLNTLENEMQYLLQHKIEKVKKKAELSPEDNKRVGEFREKKVKDAVQELYDAFASKVFKIDSDIDKFIANLGKN